MRRIVVGLGAMWAFVGCTIVDPSHCANQNGNATCRELHPEAPVCDRCVAARNGCIETSYVPSCPVEEDSTEGDASGENGGTTIPDRSSDGSGTSDPTVESASGTGEMGSSTSTGSDGRDDTTTEPVPQDSGSSSEDGPSGSSSEDGPDHPICGDEVITPPEECDGDDLGGATCSSVMGNEWDGELHCGPRCEYATVDCCKVVGASCVIPVLPALDRCCGTCKLLPNGGGLAACSAD